MFKLFRKDMVLFFNDQKSFILTFLLPVILITLFAFAYGAIGSYAKGPDSLKLQVVDLDNSRLSGSFIADLDSLEGMTIIRSDPEESQKLIIEGKYAGALLFGMGFQDSLVKGRTLPLELLYDKEKELETGLLRSVIISTIMSTAGRMEMERQVAAMTQGLAGMPVTVNPALSRSIMNVSMLKMTSIVGEKNDHNLGLIQAVAGTAILMLLFSVAGVGTSILEEKENGTINRLLYSPVNSNTILYSKMLFAFFIAVVQLTVMFLFAWIFLHLNIFINPEALVLMILATAFAVSSIGIFLAAIARSRHQAQSLSTLIILVMSAIGGSMIPLFIMPEIMSKIAVFSVNYWGIQGFYDIFWRGLTLAETAPKIYILTGTGIVLTFISVQLFKKSVFRINQ